MRHCGGGGVLFGLAWLWQTQPLVPRQVCQGVENRSRRRRHGFAARTRYGSSRLPREEQGSTLEARRKREWSNKPRRSQQEMDDELAERSQGRRNVVDVQAEDGPAHRSRVTVSSSSGTFRDDDPPDRVLCGSWPPCYYDRSRATSRSHRASRRRQRGRADRPSPESMSGHRFPSRCRSPSTTRSPTGRASSSAWRSCIAPTTPPWCCTAGATISPRRPVRVAWSSPGWSRGTRSSSSTGSSRRRAPTPRTGPS